MNRNLPIQPTRTAVASVTGQLPLVANVDAVVGRETLVHGIDISYSTASSYQAIITDSTAAIWSARFNQVLNIDFGSAPLQTTEASSIQVVCASGPSGVEGRATLRFTQ